MSIRLRDLLIGAGVGYAGSLIMDQATTWFFARQSEVSRAREAEIEPGGTPVLGGRKIARLARWEVDDGTAGKIGLVVHRTLGVSYGLVATKLVTGGRPPLVAGFLTGAAAFFAVDEAVMSTAFVPPPWEYPAEAHLRGALGHLAYGLSVGAMLALAQRTGLIGR